MDWPTNTTAGGPPPRRLGSETEMLVKKGKRGKKEGKEDDKKDCDVAMRLSVEDDWSVILNGNFC